MAQVTPCQTPGSMFSIHINKDMVECKVKLPFEIPLLPGEEEILEANLHNALELVLARYFNPAHVK